MVVDGDAEPVRPGAHDQDLVYDATQLEVDRAADLVLHLRSSTAGRLQQAGDLDLLLVLVGLDPRRHQRDSRMMARDQSAFAADPVDPAGVSRPVDDLRLVEEIEDELLLVAPPSMTTWSRRPPRGAGRGPRRGCGRRR